MNWLSIPKHHMFRTPQNITPTINLINLKLISLNRKNNMRRAVN